MISILIQNICSKSFFPLYSHKTKKKQTKVFCKIFQIEIIKY